MRNLVALAALAIAVSACGKSRSGGGAPPTVLFQEPFDSFSTATWTVVGTGQPLLDMSNGRPGPSLDIGTNDAEIKLAQNPGWDVGKPLTVSFDVQIDPVLPAHGANACMYLQSGSSNFGYSLEYAVNHSSGSPSKAYSDASNTICLAGTEIGVADTAFHVVAIHFDGAGHLQGSVDGVAGPLASDGQSATDLYLDFVGSGNLPVRIDNVEVTRP